jgi:hypothetical protein
MTAARPKPINPKARASARQSGRSSSIKPDRARQGLRNFTRLEWLGDEPRPDDAMMDVTGVHPTGHEDHRELRMKGSRISGHIDAVRPITEVDIGQKCGKVLMAIDGLERSFATIYGPDLIANIIHVLGQILILNRTIFDQ